MSDMTVLRGNTEIVPNLSTVIVVVIVPLHNTNKLVKQKNYFLSCSIENVDLIFQQFRQRPHYTIGI